MTEKNQEPQRQTRFRIPREGDEIFLTFFVIYKHPRDFPGKWVLRAQYVLKSHTRDDLPVIDPRAWVSDTLEGARSGLPPGLYNIHRFDEDDPAIYEVWI